MKKRLESGKTPLFVPSSFLTEEKNEYDPEDMKIKLYLLGISFPFFFPPTLISCYLSYGMFILYLSYNKFTITFPLVPYPCLKRWMSSKTSFIRLPNYICLWSCLQDTAWTGDIEQDQFSLWFLKRTMRWWRILPK